MLTQTPSLFFIDNKTSAGQQSASHTVRMTPPSPYRGQSWGSTLMSLPCKGKVKIINVGPIDGLAGGHRGFSADFWTSAPLKAMNSYSRAWPKRKTAWVLSPWKGWYKSEDEPGSFFPLFLWPIALFFLSQTHIHAHTFERILTALPDTYLCICIISSLTFHDRGKADQCRSNTRQ